MPNQISSEQAKRMNSFGHGLVQDTSIDEAHQDDVAVRRKLAVKIGQHVHRVVVELKYL